MRCAARLRDRGRRRLAPRCRRRPSRPAAARRSRASPGRVAGPKLRSLSNPNQRSPRIQAATTTGNGTRPDTPEAVSAHRASRRTGRSPSGGRHGKADGRAARDRRRRRNARRRRDRRQRRDARRQEERRRLRQAQPPVTLEFAPADLARVEAKPLARWLPVSGTVQPVHQATVKAKVSGDVRQITVREGESVQAGQVLARIDTADLEAKLARAHRRARVGEGAARARREDPRDQPARCSSRTSSRRTRSTIPSRASTSPRAA